MRRIMGTTVAAACVLALAACGSSDDGGADASGAAAPPTADATGGTGDQPAPSDAAGPEEPADPASAADLESVKADVETVAVSLEGYYRGDPYPATSAEVIDTLDGAGLELSPGNSIGGYVYDPDAVEFTLCIESESGAWATYDTAPMTLRENGATGGCPFG